MKNIFTLDNFKEGGLMLMLITLFGVVICAFISMLYAAYKIIGMWVVGGFIFVIVVIILCFLIGFALNKLNGKKKIAKN